MTTLFGKHIDKKRLIEAVGDLSQVCGIEAFVYDDGMAKGIRGLDFRNGSGLRFVVLPDRGMDIYSAEYKGIPLNWRSGAGLVSQYFYSSKGWDWLRNFYGGLLVTCGLSNVGSPCKDSSAYLEEEEFGGHGRVSNLSAKNVSCKTFWEDDNYVMKAEGEITEASGQGENFKFSRIIFTKMGEKKIHINDTVENCSFYTVPHMFLYHINLGYPLLDNKSELHLSYNNIEPLNQDSEKYINRLHEFHLPNKKSPELVYILKMNADKKGFCNVAFVNRYINKNTVLGLYLKFKKGDFPYFNLWKKLNRGEYVIGFEPGNCTVEGRVKQRERGDLKYLKPQEIVNYKMEIGILSSDEEIDRFLKQI